VIRAEGHGSFVSVDLEVAIDSTSVCTISVEHLFTREQMFHGFDNKEILPLGRSQGGFNPRGSATGVARCLPHDSPSERVSYGQRLTD